MSENRRRQRKPMKTQHELMLERSCNPDEKTLDKLYEAFTCALSEADACGYAGMSFELFRIHKSRAMDYLDSNEVPNYAEGDVQTDLEVWARIIIRIREILSDVQVSHYKFSLSPDASIKNSGFWGKSAFVLSTRFKDSWGKDDVVNQGSMPERDETFL